MIFKRTVLQRETELAGVTEVKKKFRYAENCQFTINMTQYGIGHWLHQHSMSRAYFF